MRIVKISVSWTKTKRHIFKFPSLIKKRRQYHFIFLVTFCILELQVPILDTNPALMHPFVSDTTGMVKRDMAIIGDTVVSCTKVPINMGNAYQMHNMTNSWLICRIFMMYRSYLHNIRKISLTIRNILMK